MNATNLCSIVILSFNQVEFTKNCLQSIREYTDIPYEIIVIDNNSNQETIAYLEQQKDIILIKNNQNNGFAKGCNQGIKKAKGDYILLLNNDTLVTYHYLKNMMDLLLSNNDIAIVGPVTNNTIGKQKLNVNLSYENKNEINDLGFSIANSNKKPERTLRLVGFCMLFRKSFMEDLGYFDENFLIGNYEDDDLCIRTLLKQKQLWICNTSFVYHYKRVSFDRNFLPFEHISQNNKLYLEKKWNGLNWNHHSTTNSAIIQHIKKHAPKSLLHICCGLGSLGLELHNSNISCHLTGIENHPIRSQIASQIYDEVFLWDSDFRISQQLSIKQYDAIVIEGAIELAGINFLKTIKPYISSETLLIIRLFNIKHVSTIEKLLSGSVWGNTISAVSDEFKYYYDLNIEEKLRKEFHLNVIDRIDVKKELKEFQNNIYQSLKNLPGYDYDGLIYNRIYILHLNQELINEI